MKNRIIRSISFVALAGAFFLFFGPKWNWLYTPQVQDIEITGSVSDYVQKKESAFHDIKPQNEAHVLWQSQPDQKTPYALVYLHGFSASAYEIHPVVEDISTALHANAFFTRLSGHGREHDEMQDLTADQFFQDAEEAYQIGKKIGDKVILVGASTGSTLALWLAARHPDVADMILISPNLGIQDPRGFLAAGPLGYWIARLVVGPYHEWTPRFANQKKYWSTKYSVNGVRVMTDVVNEVCELNFSSINVPALVMWTAKDDVVDIPKALSLLKKMPSAENKFIEINSGDHVLAGEITSPETVTEVENQIKDFLVQK